MNLNKMESAENKNDFVKIEWHPIILAFNEMGVSTALDKFSNEY